MLNELLEEIKELQSYKYKYECQAKDKERMSEELYNLMLEKYNNTSFEIRAENYRKEWCRCCRYNFCAECSIELPENIGMPIPSDKGWFPAKVSCKEFQWS
jgi:hypothetical protein